MFAVFTSVHSFVSIAGAFRLYREFGLASHQENGLGLMQKSLLILTQLDMTNKELIDTHLANAQEVVNSQASQVKDLAGHHSARASSTVKQYAGDYSSKAQEYMGKSRSTSGGIGSKATPVSKPGSASSNYSASDFPHAPKQEPASGVTSHQEQYEKSQFGGQAVEAS